MFSIPGWGGFAVVAIAFGVVLVKVALFGALAYWIFSKTGIGRGLRRRGLQPVDEMTLEVSDHLRSLQAQLDDLNARVDFTERLLVEQRDQLRVLGIEPAHEPPLPTPV